MTDIYLLFADEKKDIYPLSEKYFKVFPDCIRSKIEKTNDQNSKRERILAYSLLALVLKKHGKEFENFAFDEKGKPYLSGDLNRISVSHTDGASAVAVSERYEVGIDIEKVVESKTERINNIISRFSCDTDITADKNIAIKIFKFEDGEICEDGSEVVISDENINEAFAKWTALEAELKCFGGGFTSLCDKKRGLFDGIRSKSAEIKKDGNSYSLSIAEKNIID